jgi:Heparinase II/III-like protein/Domain of unknown function (DUF4962)
MNPRLLLSRLISVFLLGTAPLTLAAAVPTQPLVPIPSPASILSHLRTAHPRLLATMTDFAQLKSRLASDSQLQAWHTKCQARAQAILAAPPSRYEIPDGLRLLATSRRVLGRVYTLALLYRLDGDHRYAERAWQELAAAANFKDWNPRHFLDTAEMTHAFAIGYDWLYDVWTPEQRDTLRQAMVEKGFKPALTLYRGHKYWTRMRHNWNQVCNGGIGMGALALAEVEPELSGEILHDAMESIQLAMAEFAPDGAWKEGPGYWNYATRYNVVFLAGLDTALGTDFGLSNIPAFDQTGFFPIYLTGPLGLTFNYADGSEHRPWPPQMFWLARRFKQPVFASYEDGVPSPAPLDVLWFEPKSESPKAAGLPLDKYFRGAEVAVLRTDWEDPRALFVGFKAGDNKANHSHLDLGSFVFDAAGARWALDLGADNYNLPGYFGHQPFTYYRLRAEGHNTLVINPGQGPDQDPAAKARIIRFSPGAQRGFARADLTPAYHQNARKVWRGVALLDRDKLLVQDEISADTPVELWWFMHTRAAARIANGGRTANLQSGGARLRAEILLPAGARFQLMDAQPLPTSPHPEDQAQNGHIRKLAIHLTGVSDTRLAVLLVPNPPKTREIGQALKLSALSEW